MEDNSFGSAVGLLKSSILSSLPPSLLSLFSLLSSSLLSSSLAISVSLSPYSHFHSPSLLPGVVGFVLLSSRISTGGGT
jgi:hypothetical protein